MTCPQYDDGQHCYVPGVMRTVSEGDEPLFSSWAVCCADDALIQAAKRCECGLS